jgi:acyl dehydratase
MPDPQARLWFRRIAVGQEHSVSRTVSESDVYSFAGITGDLNRIHLNAPFAKTTKFGDRLVHGAYILGLISAASTKLIDASGGFAVAYGHDRIRYLAPSFIGDTLTVLYRPTDINHSSGRVHSEVEVRNQYGALVTVGSHIVLFLDEEATTSSSVGDE